MFVAFDRRVRIHLGVVALGNPPRLQGCLESLLRHESVHDFVVSCLVNPTSTGDAGVPATAPGGVRLEHPASNLGWGAGLHRLRGLSDAEYFVWVQDDMTPMPGWLDALVAAADAHPQVGCFGALRVDEDGEVLLHNGGRASPHDRVASWNATDTTVTDPPTEITVLDWVTSKGSLTRSTAFDEVHGPDPRLWPLNHVDKDYSTHLRCHGWDVALVPGAHLLHQGSQSAPSTFREFLSGWRDSWFDARWSGPVAELSGRTSGSVPHPCADWREVSVDRVEAAAGREAARMVVPFARDRATEEAQLRAEAAEAAERGARLLARVASMEEDLAAQAAAMAAALLGAEDRRQKSVALWKARTRERVWAQAEASLTQAERRLRRARRRERALRRRLAAAENRLAALQGSRSWRLTAPLRRIAGHRR